MNNRNPAKPETGAAGPFSALIAFGDSLSDNGFENGHGFFRYANGRVWPEFLAGLLGVDKLEVRAWSGATSGVGNHEPNARDWSGLLWQVERYRPDTDMTKTLVNVQIGFNDLHDPDQGIAPATVTDHLVKALAMLAERGVRRLVVWNLHETPVCPGYTDEAYEKYAYFRDRKDTVYRNIAEFNRLLAPALDAFERAHPDVELFFFRRQCRAGPNGRGFPGHHVHLAGHAGLSGQGRMVFLRPLAFHERRPLAHRRVHP